MLRLTLVLAAMIAFTTAGLPDTIIVPDDHATIQGAIKASQNGDLILVKRGIYAENIDFLGKAVTLKSEQGPEETVIDGGHPLNPDFASVVTFQSSEGEDSVIEGFTIRKGKGTKVAGVGSFGGGIMCAQSGPTIRNNIICKNIVTADGGGIYCNDGSPVIKRNILFGNESVRHGGGISCMNKSGALIEGNVLHDNLAGTRRGNGWGGAIGCKNAKPVIIGNMIRKNNATTAGGGVWCKTCTPTISDNEIYSNYGTMRGGGIHINGYCEAVTLTNNTVCGNASLTGGGIKFTESTQSVIANNTVCGNYAYAVGGGFCFDDLTTLEMTNTIIWMNGAPEGPEIWIGGGTALTVEYSDLRGGASTVKIDSGSFTMGSGMIDADPLFVDAMGTDFHLFYDSPCRDAGNAAGQTLPPEDFEGDPRENYGTADIGADEFCVHFYYKGDATPNGLIEGCLVGLPGSVPVGVWLGSGVLEPPLPSAFGPFFLLPPLYLAGPLGSIPSNGVLIERGQIPLNLPVPADYPLQGFIGDKFTNLCVIEVK